MKIKKLIGREIFNSQGLPTIECEIFLEDESGNIYTERTSVPSGTSTGIHEAVELRDGDTRLSGKGVAKAIQNLEDKIAPLLLNKAPDIVSMDIKMIDLDGTENKSNLGANAILAASCAILKAQALANDLELFELISSLCDIEEISLPFPMFNMINGGAHAQNELDFQEFLLMPAGQSSFRSAMESSAAVFYNLKAILEKRGIPYCIGAEGGYAPAISSEKQALDLLMEAVETTPAIEGQFALGIDVAASFLYNPNTKTYKIGDKTYTTDKLIAHYEELTNNYPIVYLEDGLDQDDWDGWKSLTKQIGQEIQIVGDDLFATNPERIFKGIEQQAANAAIIKPNQIGTITETLQAIIMCKEHGIDPIISHRSGETNDTLIVDLAIGSQAMQIKAGGLSRGERLAKYNKFLRIEDMLTRSVMKLEE